MILRMKQILIQLDDQTAAQLERIVPGRSRKRSQFLRRVISRALQDELEARTREAYEKWPDEAPALDPAAWAPEGEALHPPNRRGAGRRSRKGRR